MFGTNARPASRDTPEVVATLQLRGTETGLIGFANTQISDFGMRGSDQPLMGFDVLWGVSFFVVLAVSLVLGAPNWIGLPLAIATLVGWRVSLPWLEAPVWTLELRRGSVVLLRDHTEVDQVPLERLDLRITAERLVLDGGSEKHVWETFSNPEEVFDFVATANEAQVAHGTERDVPEAMRRVLET
ncbi:MAG: hypothetical protein KC656_06650 [Myxococcales bacterium]|nr:hypothetical protein [Myxococcales bacterium]MCB9668708.1 hypothetical protein [Alphaproteobacteria bacterium]MCB9691503.1 hypothetical protein [Alphaproteobacteria bacterium]